MTEAVTTSRVVRFGVFEVDLDKGEVRKSGLKLRLRGQPFQVLSILLEHPGEVVTREEFQQRLWTNDETFVDFEHGLNAVVNRLREALGDAPENPRFIETVPRRGYRWMVPSGSVVATVAKQHRFGLAAGVAVVLVVLAAASYGLYALLHRTQPVPFSDFTITQVTKNGKTVAAAISPDGKYLLNVVHDGGKQSLWLHHILTGSNTQVIPPEDAFYQTPAFSPDNNYIYIRKAVDKTYNGFNLLRAPVLGGTLQIIVRDVDNGISFSPDGKRIVFVRANDPDIGKFQMFTANADGTDLKMLYSGPVSELPDAVAWSPDGKRVASAISGAGEALIQFEDLASARLKTFARFNVGLSDLGWLPDGRGLFALFFSPFAPTQVGFVSSFSGQLRAITKDTNNYQTLTISADGKSLAAVQQKATQTMYLLPTTGFGGNSPNPALVQNKDSFLFRWASNGDLYFGDGGSLLRISADGGLKVTLLSDPTSQVIVATGCPGGRYAVVVWAGHLGSNKTNLWRMDADGSNPKQLTQGMEDVAPVCSPDGKWVYYEDVHDLQIKRVAIEGGTPEIVPGTVLPDAFFDLGLDISRDGKLLTFNVSKTEQPNALVHAVILVSLDAGREPPRRMLDTDQRISGLPRFMHDGKAVVYPIRENGTDNLWLQPLDGSRSRQITNFASDTINMFEFSPDGKTLGVMRSHVESDVVLMRETSIAEVRPREGPHR